MIHAGRLIGLISIQHALITSCFWRFCGICPGTTSWNWFKPPESPFHIADAADWGAEFCFPPKSVISRLWWHLLLRAQTPLWQQCHLLFLINRKVSIAIVETAFYSKPEREDHRKGKSTDSGARMPDPGLPFLALLCVTWASWLAENLGGGPPEKQRLLGLSLPPHATT